jgi:RNA polymerase sigma-70 factor (ECF subfamily)
MNYLKNLETFRKFHRLLTEQQPKNHQKVSSQLLVEQCKANNSKAQMQLYRQYCDGMFIVAQRYMKDRAKAEDAMQEAFIKAFRKIGQFKGDVTFGSWLKRIVINTCLDAIKANKAEVIPLNEDVIHIADVESDWEVSDDVSLTEIVQAIERLPENQKNAVRLFLMEGYDHKEISEILGITESASRTYLHRGKLQLKESLKHLRYGTGY